MKKLIVAIAAVALFTTPAAAQKHGGKKAAAGPQKTEEQKKAEAKLDKDYKAALDSIPDKKSDPWGVVREAPKAK
jgi:Ni/Co efflux regulator RcnB